MNKKQESTVVYTQPVYMEPHKDMPSTGVRIGTQGTVQCRKRLDFAVGSRKGVLYYECSPRTTGGLWLEESVWVRKLWWKVPRVEIFAQVLRRSIKSLAVMSAVWIFFLCITQYNTSSVVALALGIVYAVVVPIAVYCCTSKDITVRTGMSPWVKCNIDTLENVMALVEIQQSQNVNGTSIIRDVDELLSISVNR